MNFSLWLNIFMGVMIHGGIILMGKNTILILALIGKISLLIFVGRKSIQFIFVTHICIMT